MNTKTQKEHYPIMFIDIETKTNPEATALLDDPAAPGNIKDPQKIKDAIEEKKRLIIERSPLDSDLAVLAGIGYAIGAEGKIVTDTVNKKRSEKKILEDLWLQYALVNGRSAGYNIMSFDWPFIMKRSFDLGVKPSLIPNLAKYRYEPTTDLFMLLCNWDYTKGHSLKFVCKRYGIEVLEEDMDGSMVKDMNEKQLQKYMYSDVNATRQLYFRMQGYYFI